MNEIRRVRQIGDTDVTSGRGPGQMGWYHYAATNLVPGRTVLDVGCGLGAGLDVLVGAALSASGQDLDERLQRPDVTIGHLDQIPSKSYDVVTCVDVIEHVEEDDKFVRELGRIARETVFVTTPNWALTRCTWEYHVREYTPRQLRTILSGIGQVRMLKGEPNGYQNWPVNDLYYDIMNDARIWPPTAMATRLLSRALPSSMRLRAHLAAVVTVA